MKLINADKVIETLRERKKLFCRNQIEFIMLPTDQKARVDEIDTCIAELVNAEEVPPAQPGTNLAKVGTDCISRQAAIDGKICIRRSNGVEIYDDYVVPVEYLKQLPSTQPEIVPCDYVNACKEATRNSPIDVYVYRNALAELKELGYVLVDMREVTT